MKFSHSITLAATLVISSSSAWAQSVRTDVWFSNGYVPSFNPSGPTGPQAVYNDYSNFAGEEALYSGSQRVNGNTQTGYDDYISTKTRDVEFNYLAGEAYTHGDNVLRTFNMADGSLKSSIPAAIAEAAIQNTNNLMHDQATDTLYSSLFGGNIYEVNRATGSARLSNKKFTHADTQNGNINIAGKEHHFVHNLDIDPTTGNWFWDVNQGDGSGTDAYKWAIGWGTFNANGAWVAKRELHYTTGFDPRDFAISNNGNLYVTDISREVGGGLTTINIYNFGNPEALFDLLDTNDDGIQDVLLDPSSALYTNSRANTDYDEYMGGNLTGMAVFEHRTPNAVPEPLSFGLVVLGGLTFALRRNRKA